MLDFVNVLRKCFLMLLCNDVKDCFKPVLSFFSVKLKRRFKKWTDRADKSQKEKKLEEVSSTCGNFV